MNIPWDNRHCAPNVICLKNDRLFKERGITFYNVIKAIAEMEFCLILNIRIKKNIREPEGSGS